MTRKAEDDLIEILYEIHTFATGSYYEVFWYHWPRDGLFPWEDFEPIVFAFDYKQELCFVLVRRAWRPIIYNPEEVFWPPEVVFKGSNHHQFIRKNSDASGEFPSFQSGMRSLSTDPSRVVRVSSGRSKIDPWIIGDFYQKVEKALAESCEP